jgi:hypothetical protein
MVSQAIDRLIVDYEHQLSAQLDIIKGVANSLTSVSATQSHMRPYCFHHGTNSTHTGLGCTHMDKSTNPVFTQQMKAATGPCIIDGITGAK